MAEPEKTRLKDILKYEADQYLSEEELTLIRQVFKFNPQLIKVLRKVFIPVISDPDLPIEEMGQDVWLTKKAWDQIPADEAKILICARQEALMFIIGGLISLKQLAAIEEESEQDKGVREKQNSTK